MKAASRYKPAETHQLVQQLESLLNQTALTGSKIVEMERRHSAYASSYPLEELVVSLDSGRRLELIFKDVSSEALTETASRAKPGFLVDPLREISVYEKILASNQVGTAHYYGSTVNENEGRYWLFLEDVAGKELYAIGDFEVWQQCARWLARFHSFFQDVKNQTPGVSRHLIKYDAAYYYRWLERAIEFTGAPNDSEAVARSELLHRLSSEYPTWINELLAQPLTVIHGDFYPSNIIVDTGNAPPRVCSVDWELAALGPGLVDLAAFTSGKWSEPQREKLAFAYFDETRVQNIGVNDWSSFSRALDLCRLHLAIQWLGWSPDWCPPPEHQNDWLKEAHSAALSLGAG